MEKTTGFCEWCNKEDDTENMVNNSIVDESFFFPPLWYHESCFEEAKDKLGQ